MKEYESKIEKSSLGISVLAYSPTGAGKTMSALTAPDPIWCINTEEKDPRIIHSQIDHGKKVRYSSPENFDDLMENLTKEIKNCQEGNFPYRTIFFDGLTFGQANFKAELEDARNEERLEKGGYRGTIDRTRLEKPDWDTLNSFMLRSTRLLTSFSKYGVLVIATSVEDVGQYKRYGGGIRTAPYLQGIAFPKLIHGIFDFIGYIVSPFSYDENGNISLPKISFISKDDMSGDTFLARSSSDALNRRIAKYGYAPLDWDKILKAIKE